METLSSHRMYMYRCCCCTQTEPFPVSFNNIPLAPGTISSCLVRTQGRHIELQVAPDMATLSNASLSAHRSGLTIIVVVAATDRPDGQLLFSALGLAVRYRFGGLKLASQGEDAITVLRRPLLSAKIFIKSMLVRAELEDVVVYP